MKRLFVLLFALLPSIALADGVSRPADDSGAPAIVNPCMRDEGSGGGVSEGMSMRLPSMVVSFAINAVRDADLKGTLTPCPTDSMNKAVNKEEPAKGGSSYGFGDENATLILGD
jgi:hypothetical protein